MYFTYRKREDMANIHVLKTDLGTINGKNLLEGNVDITSADLGLDLVDNTPDAEKVVASAGKLTTPILINGVEFDGSNDITIIAEDSNSYTKGEDFEIVQDKNLILTSPSGFRFSVNLDTDGRLATLLLEGTGGTGGTGGDIYDNVLATLSLVGDNEVGSNENYTLKLTLTNTDEINFTNVREYNFNLGYEYEEGVDQFIVPTSSVSVTADTGVSSVYTTFTIARNAIKHDNVNQAIKGFNVYLAPTSITNASVDSTRIPLVLRLEAEGDGFILD